jgi:DNA-binding MarR family transcriptional regulator
VSTEDGDERIDPAAARLWSSWKRCHELVRAAVVSEVTAATAVAEPDLGVLIQLESADGVQRQNTLASALGWDRTRLSHLLTRMENRGYVTRRKITNGVEVMMTDAGHAAFTAAQPPFAAAIRAHFFDRLEADERLALQTILEKLAAV